MHGGQNVTIIEVGGVKTSLAEVRVQCNKQNGTSRSAQFFYARWVAIGKPKRLKSLKWFLMPTDEFVAKRRKNYKRVPYGPRWWR